MFFKPLRFDPNHIPTNLEMFAAAAIISGIICCYGWYFWDTTEKMNKALQETNTEHDDLDD